MNKKHSSKSKQRKSRKAEHRALKLQADVISIADRRPRPDTITIRLPDCARPGDELEAVSLSESFADWQTHEGDVCIVYQTDDVRQGDVVQIVGRADEFNYIGVLDMDDYYYRLEETSEHEALSFHRTQVRVTGRVIEVQRGGYPVQTTLKLRPIRHAGLERARRVVHGILKAIHPNRRAVQADD